MPLQNFSLEDVPGLKEAMVGHQERYRHTRGIMITLFYIGLMLVGIPGNVLTCLIITVNSYMNTSPNYFLVNLALVDLVTLMLGKNTFKI